MERPYLLKYEIWSLYIFTEQALSILYTKVTIITSKTKGNYTKFKLKGNYSIILNKTKRDNE